MRTRSTTSNRRREAIVALALAGVLWGLTVPLTKLSLDWLGAGWLTVARFALAAPILAVVARRRLRDALTLRVAGAGALGYGAVIVLQNAGIERTSVSHGALIVGALPVLVAIIAAVLGRASAGAAAWTGSLIALAGVGLVAGGGGSGTSLTGDLLVLASVAGSAAFMVAQPSLLAGRDPAAVTAVQFAGAAIAAMAVAAVLEGAPHAPTAAGPIAAVLGLALAGTLAGFWLFAWAQARVPAELASTFVNLEPLVGALTGVVAFHDAFGPAHALGGVAILAGIAVSSIFGHQPTGDAAHATPPARPPLTRPVHDTPSEATGRNTRDPQCPTHSQARPREPPTGHCRGRRPRPSLRLRPDVPETFFVRTALPARAHRYALVDTVPIWLAPHSQTQAGSARHAKSSNFVPGSSSTCKTAMPMPACRGAVDRPQGVAAEEAGRAR